jgi:iron-sulfur cluster repair di-iron protein
MRAACAGCLKPSTAHDSNQPRLEGHDWRLASIAELCEHIVRAHHDALRRELPRIDQLLATVMRVHGARDPEPHDLQRLFGALRAELESHIETEERVLFPLCRAAEANGTPVDEGLLVQREHEHASSGDALAALRDLACDYDTSHALCRTHRTLLESLCALSSTRVAHGWDLGATVLWSLARAARPKGGAVRCRAGGKTAREVDAGRTCTRPGSGRSGLRVECRVTRRSWPKRG